MHRAALAVVALAAFTACNRASSDSGSASASSTGASASAPADGLLAVGAAAPDIEATAQDGENVKLADLEGKPVVVYFYPKDDTPGCTAEAQGIRDQWESLKQTGAVVIGVSTDDADSHKAFAQKHSLPFLLLPDPKGDIAKAFGVPLTLGHAKRVTFVIDKQGKIAKVFPSVAPKGHAEELLAALRAL
jgi:peroxiredoxin Q/BCP